MIFATYILLYISLSYLQCLIKTLLRVAKARGFLRWRWKSDVQSVGEDKTNEWSKTLFFPRQTFKFSLLNKFDQNQSLAAIVQFHHREKSRFLVWIIHLPADMSGIINYLSSSSHSPGGRLGFPLIVSLQAWTSSLKSPRTKSAINFYQRRQNTVIEINVASFTFSSYFSQIVR